MLITKIKAYKNARYRTKSLVSGIFIIEESSLQAQIVKTSCDHYIQSFPEEKLNCVLIQKLLPTALIPLPWVR